MYFVLVESVIFCEFGLKKRRPLYIPNYSTLLYLFVFICEITMFINYVHKFLNEVRWAFVLFDMGMGSE